MPFSAPEAELEEPPQPGGFSAPETDLEPQEPAAPAGGGFTAPPGDIVRRTPQELADDPDFDPIMHIAQYEHTDPDEVNNAILADKIQRKKGITVGGIANTTGRVLKALPGALLEGGMQMVRGYAKGALNVASNIGKDLQGYTIDNDEQYARNAREVSAGLASGNAAALKMGEAAWHNLSNAARATGLDKVSDVMLAPTGIPLIRMLIEKHRASGSKTPVEDARRDYLIRQAAYVNQIKEYEGGHIPSDTEGKREGWFGTIPQPKFKDEADKAQFTRNIQDISEAWGDPTNVIPGGMALAPGKWVAKGSGVVLKGLGKTAEWAGKKAVTGVEKVAKTKLGQLSTASGIGNAVAAGVGLPFTAKAAAAGAGTWLGGKLATHLGGMAREVGEELLGAVPTRGDSFYRRTMKGAMGGAVTGTLGSIPMGIGATSPEEFAGMIGPAPAIGGFVGGAHAGIGARSTERIARFEALAKDGEARPYATGDEAAAAAQQMNKLDAGAQKLVNYWRGHFRGAVNPNGQEITPIPISRADFIAQQGRSGRGAYDNATGRLYIVIDDANGNVYSADKLAEVLAHEGSHGIKAAMLAAQPELHQQVTNDLKRGFTDANGGLTREFQQWMNTQRAKARANLRTGGKTDAEIDAAMQNDYGDDYWLEEAATDISQGILTGEGLDRFTLTQGMIDRVWDSIKDRAAEAGLDLPNARAQGALDSPSTKAIIQQIRQHLYQQGEAAIGRLDQRQAGVQAAQQAQAAAGRRGATPRGAAAQEAAKPWTPPPPEFAAVAQQAHDAVLATKPVKNGTYSARNQRLAKKAAFDAVAAAHAASVPADYDGIKMTVSPLGFPEVSGKLQPGRSFDDWLIDQAKLTPEQVQTILAIQNAAGDTISIKYRHAEGNPGQPNYRATRRAAQERQPARFRAINDVGQIETKIFQPQKPKLNWLSKTFTILGVNNEKFLANYAWAEEAMQHHGIARPYRDVHDPRLVADIKGLQHNHSLGLTWDGRPQTGLAAYPTATNPAAAGVPYRGFLDAAGKPDVARFEFLNLLLGNEGARTGKRRETSIQKAKRELGELNREPGGAPVLGGGETNTLREKLNTLMGEQPLVNWRGEPVPGKARWSEVFMEDPLNEAISVDNIVEVNPTVERGMSPLHEHQYSGDLQRHFGNLRPQNMEQERIAAAGRYMPDESQPTELPPSSAANLSPRDRALARIAARSGGQFMPEEEQPTRHPSGPHNDEFTISHNSPDGSRRVLYAEGGQVLGFRTLEAAQKYASLNLNGNAQPSVEQPRFERRRRLPTQIPEGQFTVLEGQGRNAGRFEVVDHNGEMHNYFSDEGRAAEYADMRTALNAGLHGVIQSRASGRWILMSPEHAENGGTEVGDFATEEEANAAARAANKQANEVPGPFTLSPSPLRDGHFWLTNPTSGTLVASYPSRKLAIEAAQLSAQMAGNGHPNDRITMELRNAAHAAERAAEQASRRVGDFELMESEVTPGTFLIGDTVGRGLVGNYRSRAEANEALARAADMAQRGMSREEIGGILRRMSQDAVRNAGQAAPLAERIGDYRIESRGGGNWTASINGEEIAHGRDRADVISAAHTWARNNPRDAERLRPRGFGYAAAEATMRGSFMVVDPTGKQIGPAFDSLEKARMGAIAADHMHGNYSTTAQITDALQRMAQPTPIRSSMPALRTETRPLPEGIPERIDAS